VRAHSREQQALSAAPYRAAFEGRRTIQWQKWRKVREDTLTEFFKALRERSDEDLDKALGRTAWWKDNFSGEADLVLANRPDLREFAIRTIAMDAFPHPVWGSR